MALSMTTAPVWQLWAYKFKAEQQETKNNINAKYNELNEKISTKIEETNARFEIYANRITQLEEEAKGMQERLGLLRSEVQQLQQNAKHYEVLKITDDNMRNAAEIHGNFETQTNLELEKIADEIARLKYANEAIRRGSQAQRASLAQLTAIERPEPSGLSNNGLTRQPAIAPGDHGMMSSLDTCNLTSPEDPNVFTITISLPCQGRASLEDHHAQIVQEIQAAFSQDVKRLEEKYGKAYVRTLGEKHQKTQLWQHMEAKGWDLVNLDAEVRKLVDDGKRAKKQSRQYLHY